jgi:GT2 family glycosyltransferase
MMTPLVSIVIPSYQQGAFLARTLASVLRQDVSDIEVFVADGGSTDQTRKVLEDAARCEPRLRWVSEPDRGQAHAVNKGITATTGRIVGWLNSDDVYYPGALRAVVEFFDKNPDVEVLYGEGDHIDEEDRFVGRYPTEPWDPHRLEQVDYLSQPSVFFRRSVVDRCGLLDESLQFTMDYEYWLRLARAGVRFAYTPQVLSGTRLHANAKTVRSKLKIYTEVNDMLRAKLGYVPDPWIVSYAIVAAGGTTRGGRAVRRLAALPIAVGAARRWNGRCTARVIGRWASSLGGSALRLLRGPRAA